MSTDLYESGTPSDFDIDKLDVDFGTSETYGNGCRPPRGLHSPRRDGDTIPKMGLAVGCWGRGNRREEGVLQ